VLSISIEIRRRLAPRICVLARHHEHEGLFGSFEVLPVEVQPRQELAAVLSIQWIARAEDDGDAKTLATWLREPLLYDPSGILPRGHVELLHPPDAPAQLRQQLRRQPLTARHDHRPGRCPGP